MKKVILKKYIGRCWMVADLEIYENNRLIKTINVNKFYEATKDWFFVYEASGGSGYGYKAGEMIEKVFIGDAEYSVVELREDISSVKYSLDEFIITL